MSSTRESIYEAVAKSSARMRREAIARHVMAAMASPGVLTWTNTDGLAEKVAKVAVTWADALIAELDKEAQ